MTFQKFTYTVSQIAHKNGNIWNERIYVSLIEKIYFSLVAVYKLYFTKSLFFTPGIEKRVILILEKLDVRFN